MKTDTLILLFLLLLCATVDASQVYLYTMFHDDNTTGERFRTRMESMEQCLKVLDKSKLPMPENPSGDYEVMGAMWCGGEDGTQL
ncbi:MAG: hypothetical protein OXE99_06065 [Cellvibrionales bacterium]|nr:hypothetical protein [Cellvibrionales bacterium]